MVEYYFEALRVQPETVGFLTFGALIAAVFIAKFAFQAVCILYHGWPPAVEEPVVVGGEEDDV